MGRYDHLVHTFEKQYNHWGDFMPPYQAYFRGQDCMEGAEFYASYRCYMKEAFLDRETNIHTEEEHLCFMGYDMTDPFGSFDAEIELWIGKNPNHLEKHIITEPTIVRIPPFTWHCPLEFKRVTKPVYFEIMLPRGQFGNFARRKDDEGNTRLQFTGLTGVRKCRYEPDKKCTLCGRCWKDGVAKMEAEKKKLEEG